MTEKEHHLYGGSSADIWVNCHGWASLVKDLPPEPPTVHSLRGTALHTGVLERKIKAEIEHRISGAELKFDYSDIEHWPEEGPEYADEHWELFWKETLEQFVTGKKIYIEKKVMLFPELDAGGTADIIVLYYNDKGKLVLVVEDDKFGKVRISPDKEQLKFYLTAVNKLVREQGKKVDEFIAKVYQPSHSERYTSHKFTKSEIEKAELKYEKAIIESKKDNPKFKVGDWCTYCKAQGRCLTYKKHLDAKMELMVVRNRDTVSLTPIDQLPVETRVKIAFLGEKLSKYIKEVQKSILLDFMHKTPEELVELRKYVKVVEGQSKRQFKDTELLAKDMQELGVNPFKEPKIELKGLGAMETALVQIGYPKKEAAKIVDSYTEKPKGKPKITTADDSKPDYQFDNAASLLDDYDDSEY